MATAVGTRVGAIFCVENGVAKFFGYGVYEGDFVPEEMIGESGEIFRENKLTNPRIRLDSGEVVYGAECWWGPEEVIKRQLGSYSVENVSIDAVREEIRKTSSKEWGKTFQDSGS